MVEARPAEATFPSQNGKIAYDNSGVIYTINPNGGAQTKATQGSEPSFSPSGKRIAYTSWDGNDDEICCDDEVFTIDATGGKPFNITNNTTDDLNPSWGSR